MNITRPNLVVLVYTIRTTDLKNVEFMEHHTTTRNREHNACRSFMPKMWSTPHNINRRSFC